MKFKIPYLTRLLEIKETQLKIEGSKALMLDLLCKNFLKKEDYEILQEEINKLWFKK